MGIVAPRNYDFSNYQDPLGALVSGIQSGVKGVEDIRDQIAKRKIAQQLANIQDRSQYLSETEAGFHQPQGPTMAGNATTGATGGDVFTLGAGIDPDLVSKVPALRAKMGQAIGSMGPRGASDAEVLEMLKHQDQMAEQDPRLQTERDIATSGQQAAMDRLRAQLAHSDQAAAAERAFQSGQTHYIQGQENTRSGMAHQDNEVMALRLQQQAASDFAQRVLAGVPKVGSMIDTSSSQYQDYQKALQDEQAITDRINEIMSVRHPTPGGAGGAITPSSNQAAAAAAYRQANEKAARAISLGAPKAEVQAALLREIAQISQQYGLSR